VEKKNASVVQLFIERFPSVLNGGNILEHACVHGTAEIVEDILKAGVHQNIGEAGGLFCKVKNREDTLDVAIKLYDEEDDERCHILTTCLKYANAAKLDIQIPNADYPAILTAVGLVPQHILKSLIKIYAHEIAMICQVGEHALLKAIHISVGDNKNDELPSIFRSTVLMKACRDKNREIVLQLLKKFAHKPCEEVDFLKMHDKKNALDVALVLFDENDDASCEILKVCIHYANAAILGKKFPPSNYPTIVAAVGLVSDQVIARLSKKYCHELINIDQIGIFAVKKVIQIGREQAMYANYLDMRCQYPLHTKPMRLKLNTNLVPILSEGNLIALDCD